MRLTGQQPHDTTETAFFPTQYERKKKVEVKKGNRVT